MNTNTSTNARNNKRIKKHSFFLDLPDELQQTIYDSCDVFSRLNLDIVLNKKFRHKTYINERLVLVHHALKHSKDEFISPKIHDFLSQNRDDGGTKCIISEHGVCLNMMTCFDRLTNAILQSNTTDLSKLLRESDIAAELDRSHIRALQDTVYRSSKDIIETLWKDPNGNKLFKVLIIDNQESFMFNVINYTNKELAEHVYRNAELYGLDYEKCKRHMLKLWSSLASRKQCLELLISCIDIPTNILVQCMLFVMRNLHFESYLFLKLQGIRLID